jgi:hypothetical protein
VAPAEDTCSDRRNRLCAVHDTRRGRRVRGLQGRRDIADDDLLKLRRPRRQTGQIPCDRDDAWEGLELGRRGCRHRRLDCAPALPVVSCFQRVLRRWRWPLRQFGPFPSSLPTVLRRSVDRPQVAPEIRQQHERRIPARRNQVQLASPVHDRESHSRRSVPQGARCRLCKWQVQDHGTALNSTAVRRTGEYRRTI